MALHYVLCLHPKFHSQPVLQVSNEQNCFTSDSSIVVISKKKKKFGNGLGMVILVPILHCDLPFLTYTDPVPVPVHSGGIRPNATSPAHTGGIRPSATSLAHSGGIHPKTHVAVQDSDLLCKLTESFSEWDGPSRVLHGPLSPQGLQLKMIWAWWMIEIE